MSACMVLATRVTYNSMLGDIDKLKVTGKTTHIIDSVVLANNILYVFCLQYRLAISLPLELYAV